MTPKQLTADEIALLMAYHRLESLKRIAINCWLTRNDPRLVLFLFAILPNYPHQFGPISPPVSR